jgi:hypothetical protein
MSDNPADLLTQIGDGTVVWIGVSFPTSVTLNFAGKAGWLRFIGDASANNDINSANLIAADELPARDAKDLMSGEWVDGNSTVIAQVRGDEIELRAITEVAPLSEGSVPALYREMRTLTRAVPGDPGRCMRIAIYTGFRNDDDFNEGRLTTIAERFIGFAS